MRWDRSGGRGGGLADAADQGAGGVGGLCALADPVVHATEIELVLVALALVRGLVGAQHLDGGAIATGTRLGDDHAIEGLVRRADAGETDFECHRKIRTELLLLGKAEECTGR